MLVNEGDPASVDSGASIANPAASQRPIVLILDERSDLSPVVGRWAADEAFGVRVVRRGETVVGAEEIEGLAVVLVDARVPGFNGLAAVKRLKGRAARVPILLLTWFAPDAVERQAARRHGVTEFLHDLDDVVGLRCRVIDAVERYRTHRLCEQLVAETGRLRTALAEREAQAAAWGRALDACAYALAHDLRSPPRAVNGLLAIAIEEAAGEWTPDLLAKARAAAVRMDSLLGGLADYVAAMRFTGPPRRIDLARLVGGWSVTAGRRGAGAAKWWAPLRCRW